MSIVTSTPQQICNSPLNNSRSKMLFSFPKAGRMTLDNKSGCSHAFYDLPPVRATRTTNFGYGQKYDFTRGQANNPPPNAYTLQGAISPNPKKGFSFGLSREQMLVTGGAFVGDKTSPGPGAYDVRETNKVSLAYSFRPRTNSTEAHHTSQQAPGPGTYPLLETISPKGKLFISKYKSASTTVFSPATSKRFGGESAESAGKPGRAVQQQQREALGPNGGVWMRAISSSPARETEASAEKRTPVAGARVEIPKPEEAFEVTVDGHPVKIPKGMTVLQACELAGVDIPRFCYHSRLSIAGNCRMCLVEVEKSPKPVASCAMPALPGMKIKTDTPMAKKAREGVMEFLLMNHPLDCPICDQGGECDLQDQSMAFGSDRGRFVETKRSVVDKNLGPLVKTVMTRCIQCTRCVRFASEVAGVQDLGMLGRGSGEEIGTYVERLMTSELSGNVIDICPVGALTSKPFAFKARNWELKGTETIDVSDAVGSNIRIDSRGPEVMRVLPRLNEDINEEWISDKTRFSYDGLKRQRLNEPMMRRPDGRLQPVTWHDALEVIAEVTQQVKPEEMAAIAGKLSDVESIMALKDYMNRMGSENIWCEGNGMNPQADLRSEYLLNTSIAGLEKGDAFLFVGTNPRVEAPMVNARIRKAVRAGHAKVASVGPPMDLAYEHQHLGIGPETLIQIAEGRHPFCSTLASAKYPVLIVGAGIFERKDKDAIMAAVDIIAKHAKVIRNEWNGFNVLLLNAAQAGGLDLGFIPGSGSKIGIENAKFVYLLGADDIQVDKISKDAFVVYQGHHGDRSVYRANMILPGVAFSEKEGTYENAEGCTQQTVPAVPTVGDSRDDWKILRALSEVSGVKLPYDTVNALRTRIRAVSPNLFRVDEREPASAWLRELKPEFNSKMSRRPFTNAIDNFYMTDSICRASKTMAQCTATLLSQK